MGYLTAEQVAERAIEAELLTPGQLHGLAATPGGMPPTGAEFVQTLIRRELLTQYQAGLLLKGEKAGYFYGDYKVLYLAGAGTFSQVFRASHRSTGEVVAIKLLRPRFSENSAQYGLFVREGELGRSLRHPNIVPIYEVHSRGKQHYLVMEFVEGSTLREFVKARKRLDPIDATRLMADIARGLDYAFGRSVIHRDLKMSNVLVSSRGEAKIVDFGLAGMEQDARDGEASARTVDYAALERATGVRRDDPRSDIFFAGCIYYHMLGGQSPLYEGRDRSHRLSRARFGEIVPIQQIVPTVPLFVTYVVNKAMALDASRRYQNPRELLSDVESTLTRLKAGEANGCGGEGPQAGDDSQGADVVDPERRVMVVEANPRMQNVLRDGLKKAGYRVLLTSDPQRAIERLSQVPDIAHCIVFGAKEIGEPALDCFNRLPAYPWAKSLPALLLLGESQLAWTARAQTSDRRRVLSLPITLSKLRATLEALVPRAPA